MRPSPLQLERYFFSRVEINSHVDGKQGVANLINCEIEIGRDEDNPRRFHVILRIKLESPPGEQSQYTGEVHAVGIFKVADAWQEKTIERLVETNGCAALFAAIREMVLTVTSRGPWPAVTLNTFTFIPLKDTPEEELKTVSGKAQ